MECCVKVLTAPGQYRTGWDGTGPSCSSGVDTARARAPAAGSSTTSQEPVCCAGGHSPWAGQDGAGPSRSSGQGASQRSRASQESSPPSLRREARADSLPRLRPAPARNSKCGPCCCDVKMSGGVGALHSMTRAFSMPSLRQEMRFDSLPRLCHAPARNSKGVPCRCSVKIALVLQRAGAVWCNRGPCCQACSKRCTLTACCACVLALHATACGLT